MPLRRERTKWPGRPRDEANKLPPLTPRHQGPRWARACACFYYRGMSTKTEFTADEARAVGEQIGIDWATAPFDLEQFRLGMGVELEHGLHDPQTDVTGSDPVITGKIALAHLKEFPDYYTRLAKMEAEAEAAG